MSIDLCLFISQTPDDPLCFLHVPLSKVTSFSKKPYKWLRYCAYSITGIPNGNLYDLSSQPNPTTEQIFHNLPVVDYERSSVAGPQRLFYWLPEAEWDLIDPHVLNDRTSISSGSGQGRSEQTSLRRQLMARDQHCLITGSQDPVYLNAIHLVPHSKGSEYLKMITSRRTRILPRDPNNTPILNIDHARNAIILRTDFHAKFGSGRHFAILKTPNFALQTGDLLITKQELHQNAVQEPDELSFRYTINWIIPEDKESIPDSVTFGYPNGVGLFIENIEEDFPPDYLFDYIYGAVLLGVWSTEAAKSRIQVMVGNSEADGEYEEAESGNDGGEEDEEDEEEEEEEKEEEEDGEGEENNDGDEDKDDDRDGKDGKGGNNDKFDGDDGLDSDPDCTLRPRNKRPPPSDRTENSAKRSRHLVASLWEYHQSKARHFTISRRVGDWLSTVR